MFTKLDLALSEIPFETKLLQTNWDGIPPSVQEITTAMYPKVEGFDVLLALEEAGAHVEHLYQHGRLEVTNLDEVEWEDNPALRYAVA